MRGNHLEGSLTARHNHKVAAYRNLMEMKRQEQEFEELVRNGKATKTIVGNKIIYHRNDE